MMSIDDAIKNTLSAFTGCVRDDPGIEQIISIMLCLKDFEIQLDIISSNILDINLLITPLV